MTPSDPSPGDAAGGGPSLPVAVAPSPETLRAEAELRAEAVRRWSADRTWFVFRRPHLATLAMYLEIVTVIDERLPTAATDGRSVFVNPYWLRTLSEDDRRFVLAHEVWHCALSHATRRGDRHPELWNIAADHEVNKLLVGDGLSLPEGGVLLPEMADLHAERVYELLARRKGTAADPRLTRAPDHDVHLTPDAPPEVAPRLPPAFGPIEGRRDASFATRYDTAQDAVWDRRIVAHGARFAGRLPGVWRIRLERLTAPRIDWRAVLRDFVASAASSRFAWVPPSRRHLHRSWFLPSRPRAPTLRLAVAIDTSGSTELDWPWFVSEVRAICRSFDRFEVRLLLCDSALRHDEVLGDDHPRQTPLAALSGGGGTDFRPVFARLVGDPPPALVFFTDGMGPAPTSPPPYPVLWCLVSQGHAPAPWGSRVAVPARRRPAVI